MERGTIDFEFWQDPDVLSWTPEQKFFFLHLLTNPRIKTCGIYEISFKLVEIETGYSIETIRKLLAYFAGQEKIVLSKVSQEIAIVNWLRFHRPANPNIVKAIASQVEKVKDQSLVEKVHGLEEALLAGEGFQREVVKQASLFEDPQGGLLSTGKDLEAMEEANDDVLSKGSLEPSQQSPDGDFSGQETVNLTGQATVRKRFQTVSKRFDFKDFKKERKVPKESKEFINPLNSPKNERQAQIEEIIQALNEGTGSSFSPHSKASQRQIHARLAEYPSEEIQNTVRYMIRKWRGTEFEQYLTPNTLFRPSKFEMYHEWAMKARPKPGERVCPECGHANDCLSFACCKCLYRFEEIA